MRSDDAMERATTRQVSLNTTHQPLSIMRTDPYSVAGMVTVIGADTPVPRGPPGVGSTA